MFKLARSVSNSSSIARSDQDERGANEVVTLATLERLPILSIYQSMADFGAVKRIVRGRRSEVFTVVCRRSLGHMAVKKYILGKDTGKVPQLVRIKREICNMDACSNIPFVTKLFGFFREGRSFHLAIELFPLGDLDTIRKMQPGRKLPETYVAICIIRPLLIALNGMHDKGIVHGNVIPESVFVKSKNVAYLGDFSCSTNLDNNETFLPGLTPVEYSAPEVVMTIPQLAKRVPAAIQREVYGGRYKNSEVKVDIWAIGCLTYELLVGYSPFSEGPNPPPKDFVQRAVDLGMNIITRDVSTLYFPASISIEARDFIQSCLKISPLDRPTADELLDHDWFLVQAEFEHESHNTVMFPSAAQPTGFSQGKYRSSQIRKVSEALRRSTFSSSHKRLSFGFGRLSRLSGRMSQSSMRSSEYDNDEHGYSGIEVVVEGRAPAREKQRQSIDDMQEGLKKKDKEKADEEEGGGRGKVRFGRIMTLKRQGTSSENATRDPDHPPHSPVAPPASRPASKSRLADATRAGDKPLPAVRKHEEGGLLGMFKKKKTENKVAPGPADDLAGGANIRLRTLNATTASSDPPPPKSPVAAPRSAVRKEPSGVLMKGPLHSLRQAEGGDRESQPAAPSVVGPSLPPTASPNQNLLNCSNPRPAMFKDPLALVRGGGQASSSPLSETQPLLGATAGGTPQKAPTVLANILASGGGLGSGGPSSSSLHGLGRNYSSHATAEGPPSNSNSARVGKTSVPGALYSDPMNSAREAGPHRLAMNTATGPLGGLGMDRRADSPAQGGAGHGLPPSLTLHLQPMNRVHSNSQPGALVLEEGAGGTGTVAQMLRI